MKNTINQIFKMSSSMMIFIVVCSVIFIAATKDALGNDLVWTPVGLTAYKTDPIIATSQGGDKKTHVETILYTVPKLKNLAITSINYNIEKYKPYAINTKIFLKFTYKSKPYIYYLQAEKDNGRTSIVNTIPVELFADPNTDVVLQILDGSYANYTIQGHLVNMTGYLSDVD